MKKGSRKEKKRKDRKTNSEQVLTCEHTVSGYWKEKENATVGYWIIYGTSNSIGKGIWEEIQNKKREEREGEGRMVKSSTVYTLGLKLEEKRKGKKDRKTDSEQVLTCEHNVSGNRIEKEK